MERIYPAVFTPNSDHTFTIIFPDLPGCITEGKDIANAMYMAEDALSQWLSYLSEEEMDIPQPSYAGKIKLQEGEFVTLIRGRIRSERAVKRTVSIPQWMDEDARNAGLSLSRVLQDALRERL